METPNKQRRREHMKRADKKDRVEVRTIHGTKGDSFRLAAGVRMDMVPPDRRRLSTYELRTELEEAREALGIHNVAATRAREVYIEVCLRRVGRFHARWLPGWEYL